MISKPSKTVYIAGPMRGYPEFNFPAFDRAKELAYKAGFDVVISPADMDRQDDPEVMEELTPEEKQEIFARRDVDAIFAATHVAMLPGWELSVGARAEYFLAKWIGREILDATNFLPLKPYIYNISPEYRELTNA